MCPSLTEFQFGENSAVKRNNGEPNSTKVAAMTQLLDASLSGAEIRELMAVANRRAFSRPCWTSIFSATASMLVTVDRIFQTNIGLGGIGGGSRNLGLS